MKKPNPYALTPEGERFVLCPSLQEEFLRRYQAELARKKELKNGSPYSST